MATVRINLIQQNIKPTLDYSAKARHISVLIDTGAHLPIYFGGVRAFKYDFPSAKSSPYVARISGLGGNAKRLFPIYEIPKYTLVDSSNNNNSFTISRLYVVIYNVDKKSDYHMLLGSTTFSDVDYLFANRPSIRYMQIDFDRDVYGVIRPYKDKDGNPVKIKGKTLAHYMKTFLQESDDSSEREDMQRGIPEKNYTEAFKKLYNDKRRKQ